MQKPKGRGSRDHSVGWPRTNSSSERLILEPFAVQRDFAAGFSLAAGDLFHVHREIDRAHDAVAEHLVGHLTQRIAVHADDFEQPVLERVRHVRQIRAHRKAAQGLDDLVVQI